MDQSQNGHQNQVTILDRKLKPNNNFGRKRMKNEEQK